MFFKREIGWFSQRLEENIKRLNDGDTKSIPWIFCVFAESSDIHKRKAAKALCSILEKVNFSQICQIDILMRQTTSTGWSIRWDNYRVENFLLRKMTVDEKRAILIFSSFHPNGYIREQAIRFLYSYDLTLPYLILRQNDWVKQVRQAAFSSFTMRISTASNEELLRSLPFVEKLLRGARVSHLECVSAFFEQLNHPSRQKVLAEGLASPEVPIRRACINALFSPEKPNSTILITHLKYECDPFLRRLIFQKLCMLDVDMRTVSIRFLKDKHPINRKVALQYLYEREKDLAYSETLKIILDKNSFLRQFARSMLKEAEPDFDIEMFYIDNLTKHTQPAILGLGETGKAADCEMIEPYLFNDCTAIVRAAMVSLMKLDAQRYRYTIVEMLMSEKEGIIKTAKTLIEKYRVQDFPRILEIYEATKDENTKIKCAALLFTASKWQRLIYMLVVLRCENKRIQFLAIDYISRWLNSYNKSFIKATQEQKNMVFELVNEQANILGVSMKKQILFLL